MIELRKSTDRGRTHIDWLDSWHSFSFGDYFDPENMGFRTLRVINDDIIAASGGFGTHPHRDMEILTWILDGELAHRDSTGNGSVIRPGDIQRMSAGTGILHSEVNPSDENPVHLLQIWLVPEATGLAPGYEERRIEPEELQGRFRLVASRDGRGESVTIHQDAELWIARLGSGDTVTHRPGPDRHVYVHVARGEVSVGDLRLAGGDALLASGEPAIEVAGRSAAEVLLFDLA